MTIQESIIYYQNKLEIKNLKICKECGVNKTVYSDFKSGKRNLPYLQLQKVLDYLNLKIVQK